MTQPVPSRYANLSMCQGTQGTQPVAIAVLLNPSEEDTPVQQHWDTLIGTHERWIQCHCLVVASAGETPKTRTTSFLHRDDTIGTKEQLVLAQKIPPAEGTVTLAMAVATPSTKFSSSVSEETTMSRWTKVQWAGLLLGSAEGCFTSTSTDAGYSWRRLHSRDPHIPHISCRSSPPVCLLAGGPPFHLVTWEKRVRAALCKGPAELEMS
jgi:hypothetical protein